MGGACQREPDIPAYFPTPSYELTDEHGEPFHSSNTIGKVVLANFIYTNCADTCPILSAAMSTVQQRLKADGLFPGRVTLLSFTVDPERDTPDVLNAYASRVGADTNGWKFLTGSRTTLEETLVQGFKLPFRGPTPAGPLRPGFEITHTNRVMLMDRTGTVRGILNGEELDVDATVRLIKRLAS